MRRELVPAGASALSYEIREIILVANQFKAMGLNLIYENIGDPIAKGEIVPLWIKNIIKDIANEDISYAYCDTQGIYSTREFIANKTNNENGINITANDVYFFNGLGDNIARMFNFLKREARVIGPTPAYSTHSSAEAAHSGYEHLTYHLDPNNNWQPNVDEIYNKSKYNDSIAGILLINPGNPTGSVIEYNILKDICKIGEELDLFVICDEIYSEIVYGGAARTKLSTVIGNACGLSLNGISKQIPWPGSRCGWMEVYNKKKDKEFEKFIDTIMKAKRLEVCSTTLPQMALPLILGDPRYENHLKERKSKYEIRAKEAATIFNGYEEIKFIEPKGAFYMAILFDESKLNGNQKLFIKNNAIREKVEELCKKDIELDKRFVYYLLGKTGIITVPLTGFYSKIKGIRMTLLEEDDKKRVKIFETVRDCMLEYINSSW